MKVYRKATSVEGLIVHAISFSWTNNTDE